MAADYQRIQLLKIKCLEIKTEKQQNKENFLIEKLGMNEEIENMEEN